MEEKHGKEAGSMVMENTELSAQILSCKPKAAIEN